MESSEDTSTRLARIEVKLDIVLSRYEDHEIRLRRLESHGTDDHDSRITALERWKYALPASVLATALSGAIVIWKLVSGQ